MLTYDFHSPCASSHAAEYAAAAAAAAASCQYIRLQVQSREHETGTKEDKGPDKGRGYVTTNYKSDVL